MYQAVIFSLKVSQNFISYESAEDRNLRAIFNRVKTALSCNIFTKWHFNWDALLTCQRWTCFLQPPFFPRALKMVKFKGFRPATIWRGAAFHFLAVFSKKEILWKLWLWFSKMFHQRVFPDWKWSISKFQFLRQIRRRANSIPWCIFPEASRNIEIRSFSRRLFSHFCSSKSKKIALFCYLTWFLRFAMA